MEPNTHSALIMAVTDDNFAAEVEGAQGYVLVDMWADWCTPCHMLAEHLDRIAQKLPGALKVVKLDVDNNLKTAQKYGIMSLPTLVLFKDGQAVSQSVGFRPEPTLMTWLAEQGVNTTPTTVPVAEELAVPMPEVAPAAEVQPVVTEVTTQTEEVTAQPDQVVTETTTVTETAAPEVVEAPAAMPVTDSLTTTTTTTETVAPASAETETLPPLPTDEPVV